MSAKLDLYEKLLSVLPQESLPIVRALIDAVGRLPGLEDWNPAVAPDQASRLMRLGFPLTFLSFANTCDSLRHRIADALLDNHLPDRGDVAEINGAALCVALSAVGLEYVKRSTKRTPDFRVCWPSQTEIDLEVTCAEEKPAHIERRRIASNIAERIHDRDRSYDVVLHYIDPPTEDDSAAIVKAASEVTPGNVIEEAGKWAVRAEKPQRDAHTIYIAGEPTNSPDWWPRQPIKCSTFFQFLAGPGATVPPPRSRVIYAVPLDAYVNPVQNKADRPQTSGNRPFLIAIDIEGIPGAYHKFRQYLPEYFPFWKRVSGVLTFYAWVGISRIGWTWGLIANPFATHLLPSELLDKAKFEKEMQIFAPLREQGRAKTAETAETGDGA